VTGCTAPDVLTVSAVVQVALGPTLDTLHMLCSAFGDVSKITMFEKTGGLQVRPPQTPLQHAPLLFSAVVGMSPQLSVYAQLSAQVAQATSLRLA
jgi:hypothetical protein